MKKSKARSQASLRSIIKSENTIPEVVYTPPSDKLTVKIKGLKIMDEGPSNFVIKVTFIDQLILSSMIQATGPRTERSFCPLIIGSMLYDPGDYEKMCLFADFPLSVTIQSMASIDSTISGQVNSIETTSSQKIKSSSKCENESLSLVQNTEDIYCCNVDILSLFINKHKINVEKRMEPVVEPSILNCKSWDNLPLLSIHVSVTRNQALEHHHKVLKKANYMQITLIASYNTVVPYDQEYVYTAASKMPMQNEMNAGLVAYNLGYPVLKRFDAMSFFPKWESLKLGEGVFTKGDQKFVGNLGDLQNDSNIDLKYYLKSFPTYHTVVWESFHRTLMLEGTNQWLWKQLRDYRWPFELHIYGEKGGFSFMAFLDLFRLLYPGEDTVRLAVPLQWINAEAMSNACNTELLLTPNDKAPSTVTTTQKPSKVTTSSVPVSSMETCILKPTGADENDAFIIIEVKLARPLKKITIPPHIQNSEINKMLSEMEEKGPVKRECSGRGQLERDWQCTIRNAGNSLRKIPYYGMTEFSIFNRQLSETRTRVEVTTSFWKDAAIYVNNHFNVQDFLRSDEAFEEMLMMAHASLSKIASDTLAGADKRQLMDPNLQAARHARQMQDITHAADLYLQLVVRHPHDESCWRELATCLMDVDRDWAGVCLNKSVVLDPRHPLSLLAKGALIFEENPAHAEPFFIALLALFPFWTTVWAAVSTYFFERELFHIADQVIKLLKKTQADQQQADVCPPRSWGRELGDWWDATPLLPGMNRYLDAADLLLRIRAVSLAEACVSRALRESGESAAYFHLIALCCRLRGNVEDALCHLQRGIKKYGEISYLRSLEAECQHKLNDIPAATLSFEKAGSCLGPYSILLSTPIRDPQRARPVLVDLVRRQPCAYTWMALADDWMKRAATGEGGDASATEDQVAATTCAVACAVQALKWDRRAGRAWVLLSQTVKPSARRLHCQNMAIACGYTFTKDVPMEFETQSKQSLCQRLGTALKECRCELCEHLKF